MTTHLALCLRTIKGEHPVKFMLRHGITYQHTTPQSITDEWWFWNCEGVPNTLPEGVRALKCDDPYKLIGWGLNEELAEMIKNYDSEKHQEKHKQIKELFQKALNTQHNEH